MKSLRILAVTVAGLLASWGIYRLAWIPFRCNLDLQQALLQTEYAARSSDGYNATVAARANLGILLPCAQLCPWDVRARFIAAWNLRILGRHGHAIELYEQALKYDRRPEIYVELGNAQMEAGHEEAAFRSLLQAGRFDRFSLTRVDRADVRARVETTLESESKRE